MKSNRTRALESRKTLKNSVENMPKEGTKQPVYYCIDGIMQRIDGVPEPEETDNEQCERLAREMGSPY